ncbi:hypothetical protein [Burkholderia ubonensis]|uniref:hypothetical protein n=1 Tax=Burkholderia ubonensis TaxID=101571 RepID=UPI00075414BA|nr:hypothetical protein [Burkholderia ubonensis]KVG77211.1 hypothetical protein WJ34_02265 [Burkholderia ubonensis]KVH15803.1 hypothetical protein WJ37_31220 [Burkholderia ubonensis]KVH53106.1 hypothetical protein WJ38_02895 [Burkholderia ubonensis]KVH82339.1 hypothetical protein WJ43_26190 [Burkholderia ubonensis]KVM28988.1 hypothetical protein WJ55_23740 [Burkholderia ubonensis]
MNFRKSLWGIAFGVIALAVWLRSDIISSTANMNVASYWGTVATIVALLLAVAEIAHSVQTTKSLQVQTAEAVKAMQRVEDASAVSDCLAAIDVTTTAVVSERYDAALGAYQHFRKLCVRTIPKFSASETSPASKLSDLNEIEFRLTSATRVNAAAGLSKPQKHEILKKLLVIKAAVERHNPANRS